MEKFGMTPNWRKCQALMNKNKAYQDVHHTEKCRERLTELMREDDRFRNHVEAAEERQVKRIAEILEERDKIAATARRREEVRQAGAGAEAQRASLGVPRQT